jgi:hypothetical protein
MLAPGGWILVDERSLHFASSWLDREEWALSVDRLAGLGARLGFTVRRISGGQVALEPTT